MVEGMKYSAPKTQRQARHWWMDEADEDLDKDKCAFAVFEGDTLGFWRQCDRKSGYGPDNLYCKQHAKKVATLPEWTVENCGVLMLNFYKHSGLLQATVELEKDPTKGFSVVRTMKFNPPDLD